METARVVVLPSGAKNNKHRKYSTQKKFHPLTMAAAKISLAIKKCKSENKENRACKAKVENLNSVDCD